MKYLLDTNACIVFLNNISSPIRARLEQLRPSDVALCSVVKSELIYGVMKSRNREKNLEKISIFFSQFRSLPFDDSCARVSGEVRSDLASQGTPIGPYDLQIASIALVHDLILVTHNVKEFSRVPGLRFEDWES